MRLSCATALAALVGVSIMFVLRVAPAEARYCLGQYQYCNTTFDCVLDSSLCGTCKPGQYLCPDQKSCVPNVEAYTSCPGLKGGFFDWTLSLDERVEALAKLATLEEKVAQLQGDVPAIVRLGISSYNWLNDDEHGVHQPHGTSFPNGCALGAMWDKETIFKVGQAIGQEARITYNNNVDSGNRGKGQNGAGMTMYAPNMNLVRDPRWGRAQEVYSEDPALSGYLTYFFVHGAQVGESNDPRYMQAAACCKHYAAYDVEENRFNFTATVDARNMWETYMPVFRACVKFAQAAHVMCSYNAINDVPACATPGLLNGILRDQWKWPGFVVSDYDAWAQIYDKHYYCPNYTCAAAVGINAGMDQEGGGNRANGHLPEAIANNWTTVEAVDTAFKRTFRVRLQLGMHDPPTMVDWNLVSDSSVIEGKDHLSLARLAGQKAMTLYKNKGNVLPLPMDIKRLAVIGPSATHGPLLLGNYAAKPDLGVTSILDAIMTTLGANVTNFTGDCGPYQNNTDYFISGQGGATPSPDPEDCCRQCGLDPTCQFLTWVKGACYKKNGQGDVRTSKGCISAPCKSHFNGSELVGYASGCNDIKCEKTDGFDAAVNISAGANAILMVLGLDQGLESEGHDRTEIELPANQTALFSTVRKAHPDIPIIVLLVHGGTLALGSIVDEADAILDAWYPGQEGAFAIANILFGKASPAGRAAVTSYLKTADLPEMGNMDLYPNSGSNGVSYRYFKGKVQFPFGFGLSYTTFKYSDLKLSSQSIHPCDNVTVSITVENTGGMDGDEVVQVYIKHVNASVPVPQVRLVDFSRVTVAQGQTVTVELAISPHTYPVIPPSDDIFTDRSTIEEGKVEVFVGGGQPDFASSGNVLSSSFEVMSTAMLNSC